jgi:hypothetical protein
MIVGQCFLFVTYHFNPLCMLHITMFVDLVLPTLPMLTYAFERQIPLVSSGWIHLHVARIFYWIN